MATSMPAGVATSASIELSVQVERAQKQWSLETAIRTLDNCLQHGIKSGQITCISGDKETGKSTVAYHIIANHLINSNHGEVYIIDTTGAFDVFRLHQIAISQIVSEMSLEEKSAHAEQILQRLRIMRIFDFDGLLDAWTEICQSLHSPPVQTAPTVIRRPKLKGKAAGEIPDSEDESMTSGSEDEQEDGQTSMASAASLAMVVIDNLTSIFNPMLKNNHVQAQARLITFLCSVSQNTRQLNLVTILLNSIQHHHSRTVSSKDNIMAQMRDAVTKQDTWEPPSIFAANDFRPALGKSFLHMVDLHILLSILPKSDRDARLVFEKSDDSVSMIGHRPEVVNVMEAISDRSGGRIGRWAAFKIERGVDISAVY